MADGGAAFIPQGLQRAQRALERDPVILEALTDFRLARLRKKYIETDHIDVTDLGITQSAIRSELGYLTMKIEDIEKKRQRDVEKMNRVLEEQDRKFDMIMDVLSKRKVEDESDEQQKQSKARKYIPK